MNHEKKALVLLMAQQQAIQDLEKELEDYKTQFKECQNQLRMHKAVLQANFNTAIIPCQSCSNYETTPMDVPPEKFCIPCRLFKNQKQ